MDDHRKEHVNWKEHLEPRSQYVYLAHSCQSQDSTR